MNQIASRREDDEHTLFSKFIDIISLLKKVR